MKNDEIKNKIKDIMIHILKYIKKTPPKELIASVGVIIGAIFALMQIFNLIQKQKSLDIVMQDGVSLTYLNKNAEKYNDIYPLFDDYVDSDKKYLFSENCATQLMITNHYDNQVVIDKIMLEANEIQIDYSPVLNFYGSRFTKEGLFIEIVNEGWGEAKNLKIKLIENEKKLTDYFKKEALEFEIPIIESANKIEVPFIKNSDLLYECPDLTSFNIGFEVQCECKGTPIIKGKVEFYIYNGKLEYPGGGSPAENVYGVKIETNNTNFLWEENIIEFIDKGETLVLPICFFPDKSCSLNLKISLEIVNDGKKEIINTNSNKMFFSVSSIDQYNKAIDSIKDIEYMNKDKK